MCKALKCLIIYIEGFMHEYGMGWIDWIGLGVLDNGGGDLGIKRAKDL